MTDFSKMKFDVVRALAAAANSGSRDEALAALDVYLGHVASHLYGAPSEVNAALVDCVTAGVISASEILDRDPRATKRLVDGIFCGRSLGGDGSSRLGLLLLPFVAHDDFSDVLGRRWCLSGRRVAETLFPFISTYAEGGKESLAKIHASAAADLQGLIDAGNAATPALVEKVVSGVEAALSRLLDETLSEAGGGQFRAAVIKVASEEDGELMAAVPDAVIQTVFAPGAWAMQRPASDVRSTVSRAIIEILGRLSEKLADRFDVEKPSFSEWAKTAGGDDLLSELCDDGVDVCSGVAEEAYVDESKTFVIFQSWDQLHTLERHVDLDSVDHGFSDEYSRCDCGNCNVAVRTTHNSYSWQPGFLSSDSGLVLIEHADDDVIEEYIAEKINNVDNAVNCPSLDLSKVGFKKFEGGFESGWHPGQNGDPKVIMKGLRQKFPEASFIFRIDGVGQFDTDFSVWVRGTTDEHGEEARG